MNRSVARALTRFVAAAIVLAVGALAVVALVEIVSAAVGSDGAFIDRDAWLDRARDTRWGDDAVRTTAVVLILAGLALLAIALWPRHAPDLSTDLDPSVRVRRRDAARALQRAADVDGVTRPKVRLKGGDGRKAEVRARTNRTQSGGLDDRLRSAVEEEARRLAVPVDVDVRLRRDRDSGDRGLVPAGGALDREEGR